MNKLSTLLILLITIDFIEMAKKKSFYEILEIHPSADQKKIKKAYRKLVKKYHPDNNKEKENWARKKFIEVTKAYETLSDPEKKKIYD